MAMYVLLLSFKLSEFDLILHCSDAKLPRPPQFVLKMFIWEILS